MVTDNLARLFSAEDADIYQSPDTYTNSFASGYDPTLVHMALADGSASVAGDGSQPLPVSSPVVVIAPAATAAPTAGFHYPFSTATTFSSWVGSGLNAASYVPRNIADWVKSKFGGSASTSATGAKMASSSDSSWMLYALLAGAAAAAYFAMKGKPGRKGAKSIFPKFARKSGIKL